MIDNLSKSMTINKICKEIGIPKSSYYYWKEKGTQSKKDKSAYKPPWSLSLEEKEMILSIMNSENYYDKSPNYIFYSLLDHGVYLCSIRTMYRILKEKINPKKDAESFFTRNMKSPNYCLKIQMKSGRGISPN